MTKEEAFNTGIDRGLNKDKMNKQITIDEQIFTTLMKLVYMFVPKEELSRLEAMIDQRNKQMEQYLYQKSKE